mmetsp:Transcript_33432/g.95965  ORF Transcript_33432/g.95965 Transcript_33432/m.95965 type:complete len:202 (+) Transcript_33432:324-929(+)
MPTWLSQMLDGQRLPVEQQDARRRRRRQQLREAAARPEPRVLDADVLGIVGCVAVQRCGPHPPSCRECGCGRLVGESLRDALILLAFVACRRQRGIRRRCARACGGCQLAAGACRRTGFHPPLSRRRARCSRRCLCVGARRSQGRGCGAGVDGGARQGLRGPGERRGKDAETSRRRHVASVNARTCGGRRRQGAGKRLRGA